MNNYIQLVLKEIDYVYTRFAVHNNSMHFKFIASSFIIAFVFFLYQKKTPRQIFRRFKSYLKSKRYQQELIKDFQMLGLRTLIKPLVLILIGFKAHKAGLHLKDYLISHDILVIKPLFYLDSFYGTLFQTIVTALIVDLGANLAHRYAHQIQNLWFFHMTHHRATALNPLTKLREHPLDFHFRIIFASLVVIPLIYIFDQMYVIPKSNIFFIRRDFVITVSYFLTNHLNHSHVRLHYPKWISYFIASPAMHHIHHSTNPKHFDKNFSAMFSIWDTLFGTVYIPAKNEYFKYGIAGEERNKIISAWEEMTLPFKLIYRKYTKKAPSHLNSQPISSSSEAA